jgi:TamB, inner membrane protein subunit of TAM complex
MSPRFPSTPPATSPGNPLPSSGPATMSEGRRPPRKWRRRLRRLTIGFFATIVGLIATVLAVLHTDWGREQIRVQLVNILGDMFPGGVELRRLEGSILTTLTTRDIALYDARGRRVVAIERARIDLGLLALLRNTIELNELSVDGVTVLAFEDSEGVNLANLKKPTEDDGTPSTWTVDFENINLTRASFAFVRPNADMPWILSADHIDQLELHGSVKIAPDRPGPLGSEAAQGSTITADVSAGGVWRERNARAQVQADAKIAGGVVSVSKADVSFAGLRALVRDLRYTGPSTSSGTVEVHAAEGALLTLAPTLPASPPIVLTARVAPLGAGVMQAQLDGKIGEAHLAGNLLVTPLLARPRLTGQLHLANVRPAGLLGPTAPPALAELALAEAHLSLDASAALSPFSIDGVVAAVKLAGRIDHGVSRMPINAAATLQGRHLVAELSGATGASQISASADVTLTEADLLAIKEARVSGHLAAADVPAQYRKDQTIAGNLDISLRAAGALSLAGPEEASLSPEAAPDGAASPRGRKAPAATRTARAAPAPLPPAGSAMLALAPTAPATVAARAAADRDKAAAPPELPVKLTPAASSAARTSSAPVAKALRSAKAAAASSAAGNDPPQQLAVTGMIDGTGLRFDTWSAGKVRIELTPAVIATWPRGLVKVAITDVTQAGKPMPNLEIRADSQTPGVVNLDARLKPRYPRAPGEAARSGAERSDLDAARTVAKAAAAAAMALSTATAPPAAVATTTVKSLAVAVAAATGKPPKPIAPPPTVSLLDALSAEFSTTGKLGLNATVKLGLETNVTTINVREVDAALRTLILKGRGGEISISPNRLDIRGLRLHTNFGDIAADVSRVGKQFSGTVDLQKIELAPLGAVLPPLHGLSGTIGLRATGSLRGRVLQAEVRGAAQKLVAAPGAAAIDADLVATAGPQLIHLAVRARNNAVGEIVLGLDAVPPADPTDVAAWMAIERSAIQRLSVHSPRINLAALRNAFGAPPPSTNPALQPATAGPVVALDGRAAIDLELTPAGGTLRAVVDDVVLPGAPSAIDVTADLTVDAGGRGALAASAKMTGVAAKASAVLQLPDRPLAPGAWALTAERLSRATLEVPSFVVGDAMAKQLNLGTWRGRAAATFELEQGLSQLRGKVMIDQVRGGPLQRPLAVLAELSMEGGKAKLTATANLDTAQALRIEASMPLTLDPAGFASIQTRPVEGKVVVGPLEAAQVAVAMGATARTLGADVRPDQSSTSSRDGAIAGGVVGATLGPSTAAPTPPPTGVAPPPPGPGAAGSAAVATTASGTTTTTTTSSATPRRRLTGTLRGEIKLTGTLADPALDLDLVIADLGSQRSKIKELKIGGTFKQGALHAEIIGAGDKGGTLKATADLDPRKPTEAKVAINAKAFELSPLARLVPTVLLGVTAQLDGDVVVTGLDPRVMRVAGNLTIGNIRLPIANQVGALTEGVVKLGFKQNRAEITLNGKIEGGKVDLKANAVLDGILPRSGSLDLTVTELSLITPLTPTINANLRADARLDGKRWQVDAKLTKGVVKIPASQGRVLHPVGPPPDLVFVTNARTVTDPPPSLAESARSWAAGRARNPWLTIALRIEEVLVRSVQATGTVRGKMDVAIADDGLSVDGALGVRGGDVMLFGRHYDVSRANVTFDGPIDPVIDLQIKHDFSQLTLMASAYGRASNAKLRFSSDPATYSEAQLLGFFLGGNPGSGRDSTPDAANSVAAAVASQTLGSLITRQLPVRIDVLAYQPQTLSSSGSLVAGRWLTEKLLLLVRSRSDPRPLENSAEGELQYWLRRGLLLDGVAGDKGTFGLDLLWNRRW